MIKFLGLISSQPSMQIAYFHLFFNIITTLLLLPMINLLVYIACKIIKDKSGKNSENKKPVKAFKFINKRFLKAPDIAVEQIKKEIKNMATLAKKNLVRSISELLYQNNEYIEEISVQEELIDFLNIEITKFLVKTTSSISEKAAEDVTKYFHLLNDIERIGDHAKKILDESNEMRNKGIKFSQEALDEFNKAFDVIEKLFDLSIKAFDNNTEKGIEEYSTLEKFKNYEKEYIQKHFERLRQGKCSMELGSFLTSTFAHFNSITSHLENIIGSFKEEEEILKNNTFDNKNGYFLVINQNSTKSKGDELSSTRKYLPGESSITENIENTEKVNNSIN